MKESLFLILLSILLTGCYMQPLYEQEGNSVIFQTSQDAVYKLTAYSDEIVNVRYQKNGITGKETYAPVDTNSTIAFQIEEYKNRVVLLTGSLKTEVQLRPFSISFFDVESGIKLSEDLGTYHNGDTVSFRFSLDSTEAIYGTGSRAALLDLRGQQFMNYNKPWYGYGYGAMELNFNIPHLLSSKDYMLLIDNPAKAWFDIGKSDPEILDFTSLAGNTSYYVVNGGNFPELINNYTRLTGRQPLPPIWAFGNIHSRFGYRSRDQLEKSVEKALTAGYPIDAVVLDIYWFGPELEDGQMGRLDWDLKKWPEPQNMISDLHKQDIKVISVSEPFFTLKSGNFELLAEEGLLATDTSGKAAVIPDFYFGKGGLLDIFNPAAKDWIWEQYRRLLGDGIDGFWVDLGEPEKHPDYMRHYTGTADEIHGLYGHEWSCMLYTNFREDYPDRRLFQLGRAGFAGSQRFGMIPWSGDVSRSWSGLKAQLPIMLNMGISGMSYMHSDAGGFSNVQTADPELYTRWLQFATFTPVFRPHADEVVPPEPVYWSDEVQEIVKPFVQLRYDLLPYNYTAAWQNSQTGMPLARAMFTVFRDVPDSIRNQYMWGDHLLVAPILNPETETRKTYLPMGSWYDFWTGESLEGGNWVERKVTNENIPVFVKGGSVIPQTKGLRRTSGLKDTPVYLTYYLADRRTTSKLYLDDGLNPKAFSTGEYALLEIAVDNRQDTLELQIEVEGDMIAKGRDFYFSTITGNVDAEYPELRFSVSSDTVIVIEPL